MKIFDWQYYYFIECLSKYIVVVAGRRTGKTKGASMGAIYSASQGDPVLWVDTIYSNIDRYYQRYFKPFLDEEGFKYDWNTQKKILKIGSGYIDFRSADKPENIEGFGYRKIFLNEAGIILNNEYLFTNAILPMMLDYSDSQLIAFGTPKGKKNKKQEEHRFYSLFNSVNQKEKGYKGIQLSTYGNPELTVQSIKDLEEEIRKINPDAVQQEIYAQFLESAEGTLFSYSDFDYFKLSEYNQENKEYNFGYIDSATGGGDNTCYVYGELNGGKVYITEVLMIKEDTTYSIPACAELTDRKKTRWLTVETNGSGAVFFQQLANKIPGVTELRSNNVSTNKETRIIQNAHFIKTHFVFREDYETGSDYDRFMKELFSFNKDKSVNRRSKNNDDAPDALSGLSNFVQINRNIFKLE